jgi:dTDP-4-dehydrorhamnose 3,5-epimerase
MIFRETTLPGAFVIELEMKEDQRGWFARSFDAAEFRAWGLEAVIVQCNVSWNARKGTLRGMHYQEAPYAECKLVRCTRGAIYDVIIDLRPASDSYGRWFAVELTPENGLMLYIPAGLAHGFHTLANGSEVFYQMSGEHVAEAARGVRWDDPAFGIEWPDERERTISERDLSFPDFS